jgi:hypothetical protein
MTTSSADYTSGIPDKPVSVDELFRNVPVQSVEDLACAGIFDTDEELDEFLEYIYAARRADLA